MKAQVLPQEIEDVSLEQLLSNGTPQSLSKSLAHLCCLITVQGTRINLDSGLLSPYLFSKKELFSVERDKALSRLVVNLFKHYSGNTFSLRRGVKKLASLLKGLSSDQGVLIEPQQVQKLWKVLEDEGLDELITGGGP